MTEETATVEAPPPSPPAITLTVEQSRAQDAVGAWLKSCDKPFFTIHGAAGVGKTSLAKAFTALQSGRVLAAAYSGKAASVLRKKGFPAASTIHSLLYAPLSERNEELTQLRRDLEICSDDSKSRRLIARIEKLSAPTFVLKAPEKSALTGASLLVLDECSMVGPDLASDLLSFKVPILVLGDPYQLPPIEGGGYFDRAPDFMLTEVHRQAKESPVIQLATRAREGLPLTAGMFGTSRVIRRAQINAEAALGVAQILSCSNRARIELNAENRKLRGFEGPWPRKGERLICLRNNPQTGILNGDQIELSADAEEHSDAILSLPTTDRIYKAYKLCFSHPERLKAMPYSKRAAVDEFDYAYCCTIHKFQGSQAPSILMWDDLWAWKPEMQRKSRYTGITRAEDRVIIAL